MISEIHTIRNFRGSSLGIIRLNKLAYPDKSKIKITIGGRDVKPIGFDTYGHPIISENNFVYYQALKANADRRADTFLTEVSYEPKPFCVREEIYDSKEAIEKAANGGELKKLKDLLIHRKQAAFVKMELHNFLLYGKYVLASNGHIYLAENVPEDLLINEETVVEVDETTKISRGKEIHIPSEEDVCAVCGEKFTLKDVEEQLITENGNLEKVHCKCHEQFTTEVNMKKASQIIDAIYDGRPEVEIRKEWDNEDQKEKVWYCYTTRQGTVSIRFKHKVIVIEWHDNFKPFNMSIFKDERVTKYDRGIHAWSKDDAIRYLSMAKRA